MLVKKVFLEEETKIITIQIHPDAAAGGQVALANGQLPFMIDIEYLLIGVDPEGCWIVKRYKSILKE